MDTYRLRATRDGFSSRVHFHEPGPGTTLARRKWSFRATRTPLDHSVEFIARDDSEKRFIGEALFDPPLHKGDEVEYEIRSETADTYIMTRDEIENLIRQKKWLLNEPYEWTKFLVLYPTQKISI